MLVRVVVAVNAVMLTVVAMVRIALMMDWVMIVFYISIVVSVLTHRAVVAAALVALVAVVVAVLRLVNTGLVMTVIDLGLGVVATLVLSFTTPVVYLAVEVLSLNVLVIAVVVRLWV